MAQNIDRPHITTENTHCRTCGQLIIEPTTAKCESCGEERPSKPFPNGWIQRGMSKYERQYQRRGIAWWCPTCARNVSMAPVKGVARPGRGGM